MHGDSTLCTERCRRFAPNRKQGRGRTSCPRCETAGRFHGLVSFTSAPVSKESANFIQNLISNTDDVLTSFASFKFRAGYTRRALMATCATSACLGASEAGSLLCRHRRIAERIHKKVSLRDLQESSTDGSNVRQDHMTNLFGFPKIDLDGMSPVRVAFFVRYHPRHAPENPPQATAMSNR